MAKALRKMDEKISGIDLFVEVRDARLPLSSINPVFERFAGGPARRADRLIVYCKRDLADARFEAVTRLPGSRFCLGSCCTVLQSIVNAFQQHNGSHVAFVNTRADREVRNVMRLALRMHLLDITICPRLKPRLELAHASRLRSNVNEMKPTELHLIIAGMPNVGKSSLLNAFRRVGLNKGELGVIALPDHTHNWVSSESSNYGSASWSYSQSDWHGQSLGEPERLCLGHAWRGSTLLGQRRRGCRTSSEDGSSR